MKSAGNQLRSYNYIADCASGLITVLINGKSGAPYNIANPNVRITIAKLAEIIAKAVNKKVIFADPSVLDIANRTPIAKQVLSSKKLENLAYGKDDRLPANTFQRAGYTFIGWSEDPDAIKPKYTDGQTVNTLCDAGQTYELYAIWKKSDGSFDLHNLIRDDAMFQGDVEIEGGNKTGFSRDHIDSEYGRIDKNNQPGYFTDRYK